MEMQMNNPASVNFSNIEYSKDAIQSKILNQYQPICKPTWLRITINAQQSKTDKNEVMQWLSSKCKGQFICYDYSINYGLETTVVIRFENETDAILFKLSQVNKQ
jgi:hypothetical protein